MRNAAVVVLAVFCAVAGADARVANERDDRPLTGRLQRVLILDGSPVHDVGGLQLHMGNFATFGSMPNSTNLFEGAPSAMWPAGSGTEYLHLGGLWVSARKAGGYSVSTGNFDFEMRLTFPSIRAAQTERIRSTSSPARNCGSTTTATGSSSSSRSAVTPTPTALRSRRALGVYYVVLSDRTWTVSCKAVVLK